MPLSGSSTSRPSCGRRQRGETCAHRATALHRREIEPLAQLDCSLNVASSSDQHAVDATLRAAHVALPVPHALGDLLHGQHALDVLALLARLARGGSSPRACGAANRIVGRAHVRDAPSAALRRALAVPSGRRQARVAPRAPYRSPGAPRRGAPGRSARSAATRDRSLRGPLRVVAVLTNAEQPLTGSVSLNPPERQAEIVRSNGGKDGTL